MNTLITILLLPFLGLTQSGINADAKQLAYHEFSLNDRYANTYVNDVFKDNILLTLDYATGGKIDPSTAPVVFIK
jgi:hypothetical protein